MGQFEWESSNLKTAYPFETPGIFGVNEYFADAMVLDNTTMLMRVQILDMELYSWNPDDITVNVRYINGAHFFAATPVITVSSYGIWKTLTLYSASEQKQVTLIMLNTLPLPFTVDTPLVFVARTLRPDTLRVSSLTVEDGVTHVTHTLSGAIRFAEGYNILLESTENDFTDRPGAETISMGAIPGAGQGTSSRNCVPSDVIRTINSIGPDNKGMFKLLTKECTRGLVPGTGVGVGEFSPVPNTLQLFDDCSACCTCNDYQNCYKCMERLHTRSKNAGTRIARSIDDFADMKDKVYQDKAIRELPSMELLLRPAAGYILGVQINLLNNSTRYTYDLMADDVDSAKVKFFLEAYQMVYGNAVVIPKSCYIFNSRYGNPWLHVTPEDILIQPVDFTSPDGVGIFVQEDLVDGKFYNVLYPTQYISIFFEIYFPEDAQPEDDAEVTCTLEADIFKPYEVIKVDHVIKPFDGTV